MSDQTGHRAHPAPPPPPPALVATDLDGTLLRSDGTVSDLTRDVLADLDARGVPVVFVTARPLRWMDDLWPLVGRHGLAVVSNGAILYDVAAREVREVRGIDPAPGLALVREVAAAVPGAAYAIETVDGIRCDSSYVESWPLPEGTPVGPLEQLWTVPAVKLLVQHDDSLPTADLRAGVPAAVGERAVATWTVPGLVEISAPGVTKAATLARVCERLGVAAADVVAFGDMPNDVAMLTWAGTAYAVGEADPAVLDVADRRAPGPDEDGVARALLELFGPGGRA